MIVPNSPPTRLVFSYNKGREREWWRIGRPTGKAMWVLPLGIVVFLLSFAVRQPFGTIFKFVAVGILAVIVVVLLTELKSTDHNQ
ncbi:MAG: hypothetical protein ACOY94_20035 [Bacillota bacterium]